MTELRTPQTYDDAFPGRFLKAGNFKGKKVTLTIANVVHDDLPGKNGKEQKLILAFQETGLALVCPKINGFCLKAMFGAHVPDWIGKRVTLYPTDQLMPYPGRTGEDKFCIRVYGSPDIAADLAVVFEPPQRRPVPMTLRAVKLGAPAPTTSNPKETP